jgi:hypothetical protein
VQEHLKSGCAYLWYVTVHSCVMSTRVKFQILIHSALKWFPSRCTTKYFLLFWSVVMFYGTTFFIFYRKWMLFISTFPWCHITVWCDFRVESPALVTEALWASRIRGAMFTWHQVQIGKVMIQDGASTVTTQGPPLVMYICDYFGTYTMLTYRICLSLPHRTIWSSIELQECDLWLCLFC